MSCQSYSPLPIVRAFEHRFRLGLSVAPPFGLECLTSLVTPLCFASPSPPSGWTGDSHSPAIEHAGHTAPPPERRWLHGTAESRIGPPFGGLRSHESRRLARAESAI